MKLTKAFIISCIIFLVACSNETESVIVYPAGVLPQEEIVPLLSDIHMADAYAEAGKPETAVLLTQIKDSYFKDVLEKHNVSQEQFDISIDFYEDNIDLLFETYELVLEDMSIKEAEMLN